MEKINYVIEEYIDANSGNLCEVFYVLSNGIKVYEREYGSNTEHISEYISDYEKFKSTTSQSNLMDEVRNKSNINMVSCCKCDAVNLHKMTEEMITCHSCHQQIYLNDCEDYFYEGMP